MKCIGQQLQLKLLNAELPLGQGAVMPSHITQAHDLDMTPGKV
jgi:hypothetical protein